MAQETAPEIGSSAQGPTAGPSTGSTRRGILVGAGVLGVAGVAAACGGDDEGTASAEPSNAGGNAGGGSTGSGGSGGGTVLAQAGEIPVGGGKVFKDQNVVVTQPTQGDFKAFDIKCTHRGCPVDAVGGDGINCPCHGSKFNITDGAPTSGPADKPLPAKQIAVDGGAIKLA